MNLNALCGDDDIINPHQIAWLSQDWDAVDKLIAEFDGEKENKAFALIDDLTNTKTHRKVEADYPKYFIDNAFSQYPEADCLSSAYFMNMLPALPDQMHFDYYLATVSQGKRYGKWAKLVDDIETKLVLTLIQKFYQIDFDAAVMYKSIMDDKGNTRAFLRKVKGMADENFVKTVVKTKKDQQQLMKIIKTY